MAHLFQRTSFSQVRYNPSIVVNRLLSLFSHLAHTVLTLWALGGNEEALKDANSRAVVLQKPALASPEAITKDNWTEHLGDGE